MNVKNWIIWGILMTLIFTASPQVGAKEEPGAMDPQMKEMMAKAKKAGSPSEGHERLAPLVGSWDVSSVFWMKPGDKPQKSKAKSEMKWIMDGRFLQHEYQGEWAGKPYQGMGIIGFDNVAQEYTSVWMDNMSTGLMKGEGQFDAASKTIKDHGSYSCPMTGQKDKWYRSEWELTGKNKHIYRMFSKGPEGKEFKSMELTYTRTN